MTNDVDDDLGLVNGGCGSAKWRNVITLSNQPQWRIKYQERNVTNVIRDGGNETEKLKMCEMSVNVSHLVTAMHCA